MYRGGGGRSISNHEMFIYIRFSNNEGKEEKWYMINTTSCIDFTELPCLTRKNCFITESSCIGFNNDIYVSGGIFNKFLQRETARPASLADEVYSFDVTQPGRGWVQKGKMFEKRMSHGMIVNNNKIHVVGGLPEWPTDSITSASNIDKKIFYSECFSPVSGWLPLFSISKNEIAPKFYEHVIEGANGQIILYSRFSPNLFLYNPVNGSIQLVDNEFGMHKASCAFVDGILYYLDIFKVGKIFAYNLSQCKHYRDPVKVRGYDSELILPYCGFDETLPTQYLLPLGNNFLAIVWATKIGEGYLRVHCSKLKMIVEGSSDMPTFNAKIDSMGSEIIAAEQLTSCITLSRKCADA